MEKEALEHLLKHWIEHNKEHEKKLSEKLEFFDGKSKEYLKKALDNMKIVTEYLEKALDELKKN